MVLFIPLYDCALVGPQKATIDDFWLMIWQQKVKAVVMVTNLVENGHVSHYNTI